MQPSNQLRSMSYTRKSLRVAAAGEEYYEGEFGPWKIEPEDEREVLLYRVGILVAAVSLGLGVAGSFVYEGEPLESQIYNALCITGAAGLGLSLTQIHIYVSSLKSFVQGLWGIGVAGGLWLMLTQNQTLPEYVVETPAAGWLVGPFFAAITGVAFKEGLCYGKVEAALLFFLVPILMLSHISGLITEDSQHTLMGVFAVLFAVFSASKFTQEVKDDIGDKTIFQFQAKPQEEQERIIRELRDARDNN